MRKPPVAVFTATALALALTAGFGLGLVLLLARTFALPLGDVSWLALVQAHGWIQLFGFVGLFVIGMGLHLLPRMRGAEPPKASLQYLIFGLTVVGVALRALAQPLPSFPSRELALQIAALGACGGTLLFAITALRILASGHNPHRYDELVIGAGVIVLPIATALAAYASLTAPSIVIAADAEDRATWLMLLGSIGTTIFGVWARLAPGFVAARPFAPRLLLSGAALWLVGSVGVAAAVPAAAAALAGGALVVTVALGLWGPTIARQPLRSHARLTRVALRTAFAWAVIGSLVLLASRFAILPTATSLTESAARHAFGLGFVTLAVYGVAARALPSFLGRELWNARVHLGTVIATNVAVALRVVVQSFGLTAGIWDVALALSGALAYGALIAFVINIVGSRRDRVAPSVSRGALPMVPSASSEQLGRRRA